MQSGRHYIYLDTKIQPLYTRHTSRCICVGCSRSPKSLTGVNSSGFTQLPPSCNSNYLGYISIIFQVPRGFAAFCILKSIGYRVLRFLV
ncbi:hypothetical protein CBW55_03365 [Yersinia intermedia]|nr:hypothetical protein CBW55_03365 [Yersinia intermedia]